MPSLPRLFRRSRSTSVSNDTGHTPARSAPNHSLSVPLPDPSPLRANGALNGHRQIPAQTDESKLISPTSPQLGLSLSPEMNEIWRGINDRDIDDRDPNKSEVINRIVDTASALYRVVQLGTCILTLYV